jgi:3-hydroxyacyl-[acyl-carrier-protein] dehydratase
MSYMNLEQIKSFLPHRDPFLFIDEVKGISLAPGIEDTSVIEIKSIIGSVTTCSYTTKKDHPIFAGHFPGNPILPGVVQVEMMAQASCFVITRLVKDYKDIDLEVALISIEKAKFRKPILPEMKLDITATCTKLRNPFVNFDCSIHYQGELMSEASVFASMKYKTI